MDTALLPKDMQRMKSKGLNGLTTPVVCLS